MRLLPTLPLALAACTGLVGKAPDQPRLPPAEVVAFAPAPGRMERLQAWQYQNAVRDLLGAPAAAALTPPPDSAVNGYDAIGSSQLSASDTAVGSYEASALAASEVAIRGPDAATLLGCDPDHGDDACLLAFIQRFGRLTFRHALLPEEWTPFLTLGQAAETKLGFREALRYVISAFLQSPSFLYRVYQGQVDPADPTRRRFTDLEMATRLSFFLVGSTPDEALLQAAESGQLATAEGVRLQALRLVQLPGARDALHAFFDEMLKLRALASLSRNGDLFPAFDSSIRALLRQETLHLVDHVVWDQDTDFRTVLDASYTYLNDDLARYYGLPVPGSQDLVRVDLPASSLRAGLLGQGSFLAVNAHDSVSSPTLRGKFIREVLMCHGIPSPPPGVVSSLPDPVPGDPPRTMRERLASHERDPVCASCHGLMDPIGLGLENFDAVGAFRAEDGGEPVIAASQFDQKPFDGPAQLGALLRTDPSVARCLSRNVFRHATGHVELATEEPSLQEVDAAFAASGYRMQALLVELASSDAFRYAALESP